MSRRLFLGPASFLPRTGFITVPVIPPCKLPDGTWARSALIGRLQGALVAYANVCRHLAIGLDLNDGEVMDDEREFLVCHHHGAIFEPSSGLCVMGPCHGDSLWRWSIEVDPAGDATLVMGAGNSP